MVAIFERYFQNGGDRDWDDQSSYRSRPVFMRQELSLAAPSPPFSNDNHAGVVNDRVFRNLQAIFFLAMIIGSFIGIWVGVEQVIQWNSEVAAAVEEAVDGDAFRALGDVHQSLLAGKPH